jgi:hypothetical protein
MSSLLIYLRKYLAISIFFFLIGAGIYTLNFEREIHLLSSSGGRIDLVHYKAPLWDPYPHTLKVNIDTDGPVFFTIRYTGAKDFKETVSDSFLEQEWIIYPGEVIDTYLEYSEDVSGEVKTVLWCDSWTYASYLFILLGFLTMTYYLYSNYK